MSYTSAVVQPDGIAILVACHWVPVFDVVVKPSVFSVWKSVFAIGGVVIWDALDVGPCAEQPRGRILQTVPSWA